MSGRRAYLDWNATAPLLPEARDAVIAALELAGNPSSVHAEGRRARALIERARRQVAALVGARPEQVHFTSGATEANNWVLRGGWTAVVASRLEHDSVWSPAEACGARLIAVPATAVGLVDEEAALAAIAACGPGPSLLALQLANNETGVVQPVGGLAGAAREAGMSVLCDAVQAAGRIPIDVHGLGVDYLTLSAHKLGGPKGVGALIVRPDAALSPMLLGGGQERRMRAGTENVAGIAGFGAAAEVALRDLDAVAARVEGLRAGLERELIQATPLAVVLGAGARRLSNTTAVALPGRRADVLVAGLDLAGIAVGAGAACSSGKVGRSRTLTAMGLAEAVVDGAIRVSLGRTTTEADIAAMLAAWGAVAGAQRSAA